LVLEGIDTSNYQGIVDWRSAHNAGKAFGIVKATEGVEFEDQDFAQSWAYLKRLNMPRAAYHFFYDHIDPVQQVQYFHGWVRENGRFAYGDSAVVDVEETSVTNAPTCVANLKLFIEHVWKEIDKPVGIYTNADTWRNLLGNPDDPIFRRCYLWQASLGPSTIRLAPWPKGPSIVQYSFTGHCPGVAGQVDLDRFYGNIVQLRTLFRARQ
jgi:lysozyme